MLIWSSLLGIAVFLFFGWLGNRVVRSWHESAARTLFDLTPNLFRPRSGPATTTRRSPAPKRTWRWCAIDSGTAGAARAMYGSLEPGAAADLCCWDAGDVFDAGVADPVAGLIWAAPGRRPRHVVVAGEVVVRNGTLVAAEQRDLAAGLRAELAARRG